MTNNIFTGFWRLAENGWDIGWGWQEVSYEVEDLLYDDATTITTGDEEELSIDNTLAKSSLELFWSNSFFALVEELFHEGFVSLDGFFDEH